MLFFSLFHMYRLQSPTPRRKPAYPARASSLASGMYGAAASKGGRRAASADMHVGSITYITSHGYNKVGETVGYYHQRPGDGAQW